MCCGTPRIDAVGPKSTPNLFANLSSSLITAAVLPFTSTSDVLVAEWYEPKNGTR